jgi:aminoglycoside phosphotransferase family enzyme/predicted kinase
VVEVRAEPAGPVFGGTGPLLDVVVRMRRFPDGALWSEMLAAGTLGPRHIDAMAQRLVAFHRDAAAAPVDSPFGTANVHERVTRGLIDAIDTWLASPATPTLDIGWPVLRAWLSKQLISLAPLWEERRRAGRVRECHGDLHLANVLQLGEEATAFDGIEFDPNLRWIDVLDDIAFLAMDLLAHGQRGLCFRFIDAYLEASGDHEGVPALRFYMVCRALVRAQVTAMVEAQGVQSSARCHAADYLALAVALASGERARLAITHGLPGSGKSFVSQGLLEAAGAIRLRSDVERKRLFGLGACQSSRDAQAGGIYDSASTARTYARLYELARIALEAGWPVVVDAAFLRRAQRLPFAALAASLALPFAIIDCRASLPELRGRIERRQANGRDASEADVAVLERLQTVAEPLSEHELATAIIADAADPVAPATLAQRWLAGT